MPASKCGKIWSKNLMLFEDGESSTTWLTPTSGDPTQLKYMVALRRRNPFESVASG